MLKLILNAHLKAISFIWVLWVFYFVQIVCAVSGVNLAEIFGLQPRSISGLSGIVCMHFLHGSLMHIVLNSIGLFMVLVPLYMAFEKEAHMPETIIKIVLISGILLWVFGRQYSGNGQYLLTHVGASALSYGLTFYMIFAGFLFRNAFLLVVSMANLFWTGSALIEGFNPSHIEISWEGHLCGAVAGILVAIIQKNQMPTKLPMEEHHEIGPHRL